MDYNFTIIGIGSSAGGLAPLTDIISRLPADINAAIILTPHLSTQFESHLAYILSKDTRMQVTKVTQNIKVEPRKVFVMPEGKMMTLKDGCLTLRDRLPSEKINKAIDIFFTSMAADAGDKCIGIILSGAGYDGIEGAKKIEDNKGIVIVQDPATAQFPLMPSALIANDHPDYILTPTDMVRKIAERVKQISHNGV